MSKVPDPEDRWRPLPPLPGTPLAASQVLGRDGDVDRALALLEGASLRLNEPRRLGKSSFLTLLADDPPPGWTVVTQSFQGVGSTQELVEYALSGIAAHRRFRAKAKDAVLGVLSHAKAKAMTPDGLVFELAPAFRSDPLQALTTGLAEVAARLGPDERVVLAWDEVPDMVKAISDAEGRPAAARALGLLRRLREDLGRQGSGLRWILTGSVGFHHLLRELGRNDLVNDLENLHLGPLDQAWTAHLAERLLRGAGLEPDEPTVRAVADASGGIPIIAHFIAARVKDRGLVELRPQDVLGELDAAVDGLDESNQFTSFLTRLNPYYGDQRSAAMWILDRLAAMPCSRDDLRSLAPEAFGFDDEELLRDVLTWLELDHYIGRSSDRRGIVIYGWQYEPLRRIWEVRRR